MPVDNLNPEKSHQTYLNCDYLNQRDETFLNRHYSIGGSTRAFAKLYFMRYLMSGKKIEFI